MTVQTIDSKGKAPKRRIATPAAALTAYSTARNIEIRRDARFGCIAGIFAGFPPNDPAEMEKMGQADCPNINFRQFEAKVNTYVGNWTAINAAGSEWAEVSAEHEDPMGRAQTEDKFHCRVIPNAAQTVERTHRLTIGVEVDATLIAQEQHAQSVA